MSMTHEAMVHGRRSGTMSGTASTGTAVYVSRVCGADVPPHVLCVGGVERHSVPRHGPLSCMTVMTIPLVLQL